MNNTQRPARMPEIAQNPNTNINLVTAASSAGVSNRFAGDDDDNRGSAFQTVLG